MTIHYLQQYISMIKSDHETIQPSHVSSYFKKYFH